MSRKILTNKLSTQALSSSLKVSVYWGDILYGTILCGPNESITIGKAGHNTFVLDLDDASSTRDSLEVVKVNEDKSADIRFDDSIDGHIKLGGKLMSLSTARQEQHLKKDGQGVYHIQIKDKEKADLAIGLVSFYFDWLDNIEVLPRKSDLNKEDQKKWIIILLSVLLAPVLIFLIISIFPPKEPERPPERLVTLLPRQQPAKAAMGAQQTADGGAQKGDLGKAQVAAEEKPSAAQLLKRANIGSLLSGLTSMGANAPSAPTQNQKTQVSQAGTGGFSTEGLKTGGGGKTVGIGRTVGEGQGGFEGTGRLGLSGDAAVEGGTGHGSPDTLVRGGLSKDVIEAIIRRRQHRIRLCYERQLNFNPKLAGKISVRFVIGKNGEVLKADSIEDTMKSEPVRQCVLTEVKTWTFPHPEGGTLVDVDYPFVFESSARTGQ
ncbi:MAG: AgmX/PglI C-terminal domain-containing protein [Oligoflexia bacterium]|nr:AgmX/PglI C-terminal domain-containing protein [Oligoflexia bacterium]